MTAIDKLIAVAEGELGYLEKKSNKDLDSKTGNAGSNNYTKYNRDLLAWTGEGYISAQWCQAFVDWCFIKAFGLQDAKKLIYVWTNYTPTGSGAFKQRGRYIQRGKGTPKRGDIVYFFSSSKGRIGHVGIVYKVDSTYVYTIEGNTSGTSNLITNGGGVKKKSYKLTSTYIDGYGSVDYSVVGDTPAPLAYGSEGSEVKAMQLLLLKWKSDCLPKYGADGDFGSETQKALKAFQWEKGIPVTGTYDAATQKALEGLGAKTVIITGDTVNIRSSASKASTSNIIGGAKKGERYALRFQAVTLDGIWYAIDWHGQVAYVSSKMGVIE